MAASLSLPGMVLANTRANVTLYTTIMAKTAVGMNVVLKRATFAAIASTKVRGVLRWVKASIAQRTTGERKYGCPIPVFRLASAKPLRKKMLLAASPACNDRPKYFVKARKRLKAENRYN